MTEEIQRKLEKLVVLMGFREEQVSVIVDESHRRVAISIDDEVVRGEHTPRVLSAFHHLVNQFIKRRGGEHHVVDLNYYRRERERLIAELTRAAARKAMVSHEDVELPPMNAYERRIVHMEIASHPELKTESEGVGKERHVVIKRL